MTRPPEDILILGNGLAATLLATCLIEECAYPASNITLCAPDEPIASDVPGALMHPLPGSSLTPKPDVMLAYEASIARLTSWLERYPEYVLCSRMLRLDRGARRGKRYLKSYANSHHLYSSHMHHELLSEEELSHITPALSSDTRSAIAYGPTYCVALGKLLPLLREDLRVRGVKHINKKALSVQSNTEGATTLLLEGQATHTTSCLVFACGPSLPQFFPHLDLGINGGELLVIEASAHPMDVMLSAGGHISQMPDIEPATQVMGSSYLRPRQGHERSTEADAFFRHDEEAITQIKEMIGRFSSHVHDADVAQVWRGRRTVYLPDKHPLVGRVPTMHNVFVLGALGSKGLLWAPLASTLLARHLIPKEDAHTPDMPMACSTARVPREQWGTPSFGSQQPASS